ncbi:hypothetical protein HDU93_006311, partial [Gonapodya sp. JEL0774]
GKTNVEDDVDIGNLAEDGVVPAEREHSEDEDGVLVEDSNVKDNEVTLVSETDLSADVQASVEIAARNSDGVEVKPQQHAGGEPETNLPEVDIVELPASAHETTQQDVVVVASEESEGAGSSEDGFVHVAESDIATVEVEVGGDPQTDPVQQYSKEIIDSQEVSPVLQPDLLLNAQQHPAVVVLDQAAATASSTAEFVLKQDDGENSFSPADVRDEDDDEEEEEDIVEPENDENQDISEAIPVHTDTTYAPGWRISAPFSPTSQPVVSSEEPPPKQDTDSLGMPAPHRSTLRSLTPDLISFEDSMSSARAMGEDEESGLNSPPLPSAPPESSFRAALEAEEGRASLLASEEIPGLENGDVVSIAELDAQVAELQEHL